MISTKGRYALRVMADLAAHYDEGFISLADISDRQQISYKYLEAIIAMLNKSKLVESARGKNGGYKLIRQPNEYSLKEILEIAEGSLAPVNCPSLGKSQECKKSADCPTLPVWKKLDRLVSDYLSGVTLADIS